MTVSVVIPAYNEEQYLPHCLQNLLDQTVQPLEILVIDNNSTDKTAEIAQAFDGVTVINESNQGIRHARNRGFDEAKGDIIARTDADTQVAPDWIQRIQEDFRTPRYDAVTGLFIYNDLPFPLNTKLPALLYFWNMRITQSYSETLFGGNMAIRKSFWEEHREKLDSNRTFVHEDSELALKVKQCGGTIKRDNQLLVYTSGRRVSSSPWKYLKTYPAMQFWTQVTTRILDRT